MTLAMLFPGQGSQSVGMLGEYAEHPIVLDHFQRASDCLGYDLHAMVTAGEAAVLNQTVHAQPALLVTSVAFYALWCAQSLPLPSIMAGHSLGEFSALTCAGAITFEEAVRLVSVRGQCMQSAATRQGGMQAIVGLDDQAVIDLCSAYAGEGVVTAANFNSPGQVVISGDLQAVETVGQSAKAAGAKMVVALPVSVASHCDLMAPAVAPFAEALRTVNWQAPSIPVVHNADLQSHASADAICEVLLKQLTAPVRWTETIQLLSERGVTEWVECGAGQVLSRLCKRFKPPLKALAFAKAEPAYRAAQV